jgi:PKD repeat protein
VPTGTPRTFQFVPDSLNYFSYLWQLGDGSTASNSTPIHTYLADSSYNINLIVSDGRCSSTSNDTLVVNSLVSAFKEELSLAASILLFTNPANNFVVLEVERAAVQSISLWDTKGAFHATSVARLESSYKSQWKITTSGLSGGMYIVKIQTDKGVFSRKLFVE